MAITSKQAAELIRSSKVDEREYMRILLAGDTCTGKTTSLLTACGLGPMLVIDFDQNATQFRDLPNVEVIRFGGIPGADGDAFWALDWWVSNELKRKASETQYACIVQDSLSALSNMCLAAVLKQNGRLGKPPEIQDWNFEMNAVNLITMKIQSIPVTHMHISVCHTVPEKNDVTGRIEHVLALTGKKSRSFLRHFPEIYFCDIEQTKDGPAFVWQTTPSKGVKCRTSIESLRDTALPQDFAHVWEEWKEGATR